MAGRDKLGCGVSGGSGVPPGQKIIGFIVGGAMLIAAIIMGWAAWLR